MNDRTMYRVYFASGGSRVMELTDLMEIATGPENAFSVLRTMVTGAPSPLTVTYDSGDTEGLIVAKDTVGGKKETYESLSSMAQTA